MCVCVLIFYSSRIGEFGCGLGVLECEKGSFFECGGWGEVL